MSGPAKIYRCFLFDMDGVVVDSMEQHARTWIEVLAGYGVSLEREDIFRREGMSGLSSIRDIFREKGLDAPPDRELLALQERKLALFEECDISVFPGISEILSYLWEKALPMALVTGSLRRSVDHVLPPEIRRFFTAIVTVDDITNGKPHPEPYLKAVHALGAGPQDALAIENAPLGILSARAAGIDCYAVETTLDASHLSAAHAVFTDHGELFLGLRAAAGDRL
ncbi:MAG TPA: HAD family phosphatase [Spirochaetes bacterium]|nr:HAD family phosphatase [Spirochaetota bacterium]